MDKDLAEFAVEFLQKLGASYAECRLENSIFNSFLLKNGILQSASFGNISGLGIRFIKNKTLGFATTNELQKDRIKNMIKKSLKTTRKSSKIGENVVLADETAHVDRYEVKQKIKLNDVSHEEKIKLLIEADKSILKTKARVPGRYLSLSDRVTTMYFVNSEGARITSTIPKESFCYCLTVKEGAKIGQREWDYGSSGGWEFVEKWDIPKIVSDEVVAIRNNLKYGIKPPTGPVDVVVGPQVTGIIVHESCGHPYEADRILGREAAQAGESFVTRKMLGTKIGSGAVTVVDDPTIPNSYGFYLYDHEGVLARRKILMKDGIINEFLHNRETAAQMGIRSNASSRASSYCGESIVRMSNTFIMPGNFTEEELIESVKLGVFMKNFMEWNIDDKRMNQKYVGAESYLIENGKITKPVRRPTIEINTPDLYKSIDAVGNNLEFHAGNCGKGEPMQSIPVWFGGPSIKLRKIRLR